MKNLDDNYEPLSHTAAVELLAIMCWTDLDERREARVTFAAELMGREQEYKKIAQQSEKSFPNQFVQKMEDIGSRDVALVSKGWDEAIAADFRLITEKVGEEVRENIFEPSGGFQGVAAARGLKYLIERMTSAVEQGAASAALLLILVARMDRYHRHEVGASLARAISILEHAKWGNKIHANQRMIKIRWQEWRSLAPLWAGVMMAGGYPWGQVGNRIDPANIIHGMFNVIQNPAERMLAISYSHWFIDFANTFKAPHTGPQSVLIKRRDAVRLHTRVDFAPPTFAPLNPDELGRALGHRASGIQDEPRKPRGRPVQ